MNKQINKILNKKNRTFIQFNKTITFRDKISIIKSYYDFLHDKELDANHLYSFIEYEKHLKKTYKEEK